MNRFQRLLARVSPVAIYRPIKRPVFHVDDKLVTRQLKAAAERPANGIKRVLLEDQPDSFVKPLNYSELGVIE
jgi:hypothetical protein